MVGSSGTLLTRLDGGVLTLTIDRPGRGNALDGPTVDALLEVLGGLAADPGEARAVLLRGEGKHFCTGADISASASDAQRERGAPAAGKRPSVGHMVRALGTGPHRLVRELWDCRLPVVAELTGRTSGLGLHLALACDLTVAGAGATFAEPFSERGFNVDSGGSWLLPRFVGLTRAKQLLYSARPIDAGTAASWGLVAEVVDDEQVGLRARELAEELAGRPTFTLGVTKQLLHLHLAGSLAEALDDEASAVELTIRSEDFREGMRAFAEKRSPSFSGR
jgi:2-(1,2-epoxy-1,2-dihydrophenyl)acetyl-CoA isomerase